VPGVITKGLERLSPDDADKMVAYVRDFRGGGQTVQNEPSPIVAPEPTKPTVVLSPKRPLTEQRRTPADTENAARIRVAGGLYAY